MAAWAICLDYDLIPNLGQMVVPYEIITPEVATVTFNGASYKVPLAKIKAIDAPKFAYGDTVSPTNHPELIGVVHVIRYHFDRNEPMYFIKINEKKKSKRYFCDDLIRRE
jgi:hypothetical protein